MKEYDELPKIVHVHNDTILKFFENLYGDTDLFSILLLRPSDRLLLNEISFNEI